MMDSIYKAPDAEVAPATDSTDAPEYSLYKISAVGVATFFGTVLAGGYIASRNLKRLGRDKEAGRVLFWSGIALLAVLAVGFLLPDNISGTAFTVVQVVVMVQLAKSWFQADLDLHTGRGGSLASNWRAFGISLLFMLGLAAVIFPIILVFVGLGL